jgi:FHA domain
MSESSGWLQEQVSGMALRLTAGHEAVIGREKDCDMVLSDPTISRQHARIGWYDGRPVLHDLDSTGGTFVNGSRLTGPRLLEDGDMLRLGSKDLRYSRDIRQASGGPTATVDPHTTKESLPAVRGATHVDSEVKEGRSKGQIVAAIGAVGVIGTLVIGLLTYLQNRPSSDAEYRGQVAALCRTAVARAPQFFAALTAEGYDRDRFEAIASSLPPADAQTVADLRALDPPEALADQHDRAVKNGEAVVAAENNYVASLGGLPDREFRKRPPDVPGDVTVMEPLVREFRSDLVALSGGTCVFDSS